MDKINSNVIDFSPAEGPAGLSVGQVYIDLDGTLKRGIFAGQSAASFEAVRQANNERYAASGFVNFGKHAVVSSGITIINEGLWSWESTLNINKLVLGESGANSEGNSKTPNSILNLSGVIFDVKHINATEKTQSFIKFPQAPDGKTTYHKTKGEVKVHVDTAAAFIYANQSDNIEVVTDRVDMWGFEAYLEEVTTTNPFVYPNGLIQSQATTMNGITTSASNRPVTYYAVFDGDTGSRGKGLDVTKLSYVQLATILGDHKNNLYYLADGRLVQWRLRQRTIAGAGNGDWASVVAPASVEDLMFNISIVATRIRPQGASESSSAYTVGEPYIPFNNGAAKYVEANDRAIYYARNIAANDSKAVNGECYFLVCGTVNRLNQGAYHPSFNPSGASNYLAQNIDWFNWYQSHASLPKYNSTSDCFSFFSDANSGVYQCSINTGKSGRPDGRVYDVIYADGQGGVCRDMRYSAYGVDLVDFAEADQKVKNGTYRGFEKLVFTKVIGFTEAYYGSTNQRFLSGAANPESYNLGPTPDIYIVYNTGEVEGPFNKCTVSGSNIILEGATHSSSVNKGAGSAMIARYLPCSLGGTFLQTDVIGNPTNILSTPQLANGWQGSWVSPFDAIYYLSRKALLSSGLQTYTTDNGVTWGSTKLPIDTLNNGLTKGDSSLVLLAHYQAFAKQTEPAENAVIYGKQSGVGKVFFNFHHSANTGCLLTESMLGKVIAGTLGGRAQDSVIMYNPFLYLDGTSAGKLVKAGSGYESSHYPTSITRSNGSLGSKVLNYNVNINQQAVPHYAYTELKHNGTSWGDNGEVVIADRQATKVDLNGNTVLVGTAKLCEPIGWLPQSSQPRNSGDKSIISFNQWTKAVKSIEKKGGLYGK